MVAVPPNGTSTEHTKLTEANHLSAAPGRGGQSSTGMPCSGSGGVHAHASALCVFVRMSVIAGLLSHLVLIPQHAPRVVQTFINPSANY